MIVYWSAVGKPHYPSMDVGMTIPHISDVGAFTMKPLFIAGSVVTTVFLDLAFASERWLRHKGRLARNTTKKEKVLSILSICFAVMGTAGLILLSIFDSYRHGNVHNICLALFMAGYIISAICLCWSYQILGSRYREQPILRMSFWLKLGFIVVEVILAIAFGVCLVQNIYNAGSVLEWTISFVFTFYIASFVVDLRPAIKTRHMNSLHTKTEAEVELRDRV
ncbi:hypothetical protein BP5796_13246 [Coleophoma crateriformis]|uniref:CWH43-like N-terminal domain-containing protein n=1 Tax=Coleophoma crateriformis TaxID=565419 RepID=A0A3D8Q387_9HELO|nr:hypothetical protein BP5796_13246 [Coleophoma crateriformis]